MTDAALVAALNQGDGSAANLLVERYGTFVNRVLVRVLGPSDPEIGDLTQDVFFEAFRGMHRLDDPRALKAWLARITVFQARSRIRKRQARRWLTFSDKPPEPTCPQTASDAHREAAQSVQAVLNTLAPDERMVFVMHRLEGYELLELVDMMGTSYATVRRRYARAKKRFEREARKYAVLIPWLKEDL